MPPLSAVRSQPAHASALGSLTLYGDSLAFDPRTGGLFNLSVSAALLIRALIEGRDRRDLSDILREHFAVDCATAERDVELFLGDLQDLGLLAA